MLYKLSGFRPHSSPDPFGATLPPGEGIFPPRWGGVTHISQNPVPKSRVLTASPSREKPWVVTCTLFRITQARWIWDKGFSLGRSCQPLALRNQWLTDVGSAAERR